MSFSSAIRVEFRKNSGKGVARALRRQGMIPGVLYGSKKEPTLLAVDPRDIQKGLQSQAFYTTIFDLKVAEDQERALVKDIQLHPVTDRPLHVDFLRVSKDTKVHVYIPVSFKNNESSPGLKKGGVLNVILHSLEVICLPDQIPEAIHIDLAGLDIGDSIHTDALDLPKGIEVANLERNQTLATILTPTVDIETSASLSEPELIRKPTDTNKSS